jgi:hypothetical protein
VSLNLIVKKNLHVAQRAKEAARIKKLVGNLIPALDKIPSYHGKAGFMDRVFMIHTLAHNLAWNLNADAVEGE